MGFSLESESDLECDFLIFLESEPESESRCTRNRASLINIMFIYNYCDVPGSPCLSKAGPMYGPFFLTDQRIPGPVSCRCPEPRWFVGDPIPLACGNITFMNTLPGIEESKSLSDRNWYHLVEGVNYKRAPIIICTLSF